MARSDPQMNFRIPAELKERLEVAAKNNNRSLTSELVSRLEASLDSSNTHDKLDEIIARLKALNDKPLF